RPQGRRDAAPRRARRGDAAPGDPRAAVLGGVEPAGRPGIRGHGRRLIHRGSRDRPGRSRHAPPGRAAPLQPGLDRSGIPLDPPGDRVPDRGREHRPRLLLPAAQPRLRRALVDGARLVIRGGSAGGYTTLCAVTFRSAFAAGASHFGIGDLEVFVRDTHKFESRYLDRLVGPYPQMRDRYRERSPIHFVDRIRCPMLLFQGLDDRIVPPNQAELMVAALRRNGLPVAYIAFEGEQHGFRKAENIKRTLDTELYFYSRVFRFPPADPVDPVPIENL